MAKMLRVETCDECKESSAYADYCLYTHRNLDEDTKPRIPAWCELPDAPRWVPVSERLPPESGVYNVRVNYGGQYYRDSTRWDATEQMWLVPREWQIYLAEGRVTHWLAGMPPLPKEEVSDAEEEVSDAE